MEPAFERLGPRTALRAVPAPTREAPIIDRCDRVLRRQARLPFRRSCSPIGMPRRVRFRNGKTAPEYLLERRRSPRKRPQRLAVEFARLTTGRCRSFRHQLQLTPL
jgi:hypothetical protein